MDSKNKYWIYTSSIIISTVFAASAAYPDDAKSSRISKPVRDLNQSSISKTTAKDFKAEPAPKFIPPKTEIPKNKDQSSGNAFKPKASAEKFELPPTVKYPKREEKTQQKNQTVHRTKQQAPLKRLEPKSSASRVTHEKRDKRVDSKPATYSLVPQAKQKSIPQKRVSEKIGASGSTSTKLIKIERIDRDDGKTESVTGKLTNIGQENKDLSQLREMFGQRPGISNFTDPTGESLLDGAGQTGPPHPGMPGLIEERDFLTNPAKRQEGRDSIRESFGLSTANPKDDMFNNQMGSLTGPGDSRLSADEDPKPDPKPEDPKPDPKPEDPKPIDPSDNVINVEGRKVVTSKSQFQVFTGRVWQGLVNAVGGTDGDDDSSTNNAVIGVRGTPVPDQDYSSGPAISESEMARLTQEELANKGMDVNRDSADLKENGNRLVEGVNPIDPYARPTDDSNRGSSDFAGFGNSLPGVSPQETVKDQLEPELDTGQPGPQTSPGGNIPIH